MLTQWYTVFLGKGNFIPEFQEKGSINSLPFDLFLSCLFPERVHHVSVTLKEPPPPRDETDKDINNRNHRQYTLNILRRTNSELFFSLSFCVIKISPFVKRNTNKTVPSCTYIPKRFDTEPEEGRVSSISLGEETLKKKT